MSEIAVRKLAEMIKAPVEVLLRQLRSAGIHVNGADDSITDAQKLKLLEHIGAGHNESASKSAGKIKLKKRTANDQSQDGQKTKIEVRKKKTLARSGAGKQAAAAGNTASVSRTEELARQLEAERKAREGLTKKVTEEAPQEQDQPEPAVTPEPEIEKEAPKVEPVSVPDVTPVAEEPKEITAPVEPSQPEKPVEPKQEAVQASKDKVASTLKSKPTPAKTQPSVKTDKSQPEKSLVSKEERPKAKQTQTEQPKVQRKSEGAANSKAAGQADSKKSPANNAMAGLSAKEQREAVAAAARAAAASALKRRPSRKVLKAAETKKAEAAAPKAQEAKPAAPTTAKQPAAKPKTDKPAKQFRNADSPSSRDGGKGKKKGRRGGRDQDANRRNGRGRRNEPKIDRGEVKHGFEKPTAPVIREIGIPPTIVVSDLAQKLAIRATDIIKEMMKMGMMTTINQSIDQETAILVTEELGHKAKPMQAVDDESALATLLETSDNFEKTVRPPVVTIMGHVDHGKTSLLDYIRSSRVASGEAGGITQHIGAYHVDTDQGTVTFLDTPGHAAFTKMRARGAQVTDIVILIVAADDGVMPQTKEAIKHAKAAEVPMVVVINKIDKEEADPDRVLNELSQHDVLTEAWGGDVPVVKVSAKTGQGVDELLETLLLVAEVQELEAPTDAPAKGHVIEASVERGRGAVATILVREGTLNKGDIVLCGGEYGRVRAMFDENGKPTKTAGPSIPVSILGLSGAPEAGDEAFVVDNERKAREIANMRKEKQRDTRFAAQQSAKLDSIFNKMKSGAAADAEQLNVIIKADVQGSVEAIRSELTNLSTEEIQVRVISSGVGGITESEVDMAAASKAIIIAFNVRADATTRRNAVDNDIEIRYYNIIYQVIDDVKDAMSGMLSPEKREVFIGLAEVKDVFRSSEFGQVAGCLVVEGVVKRGQPIRVLRDNVVIFQGELESLRRHRDDVKEVNVGTECGIAVKDYNDVQAGDQIECFEEVEVARKIK